MRTSASSLSKLARLRTPAAQVGVMLLPPVYTLDEWQELALKQQTELLRACSEDRGEEAKLPDLPDPMTRTNRSPSR